MFGWHRSSPLLFVLTATMVFMPALAAREPVATTALVGQVVDPEGEPVADATVIGVSGEARPVHRPRSMFSFDASDRDEHPIAEATTDEQGKFSLEVEGAAPFMLRAVAAGFAPVRLMDVRVDEPATLRLSTGWTLEGQVLDKLTGKPVAGVEIEANALHTGGFSHDDHRDQFRFEATTGEEGRFELANLGANAYRVVATADGYSKDVISELEVGFGGTAPEPVYLYLVPGVTLAGVLVTDDGSPVEGADVSVRPERQIPDQLRRWAMAGGLSAASDEDGSFTLAGVPEASSYAIEAEHDDYAPAIVPGVRVRPGASSDPIRLVMSRGTRLTARLLVDGEPFDGKVSATLTYTLPDSKFSPRISRESKRVELEDGNLTVPLLPAGTARLVIAPRGYADVVREEVTLLADEPLELGEILLDSGLTIEGRVLDPDGDPIEGAHVQAMSFVQGFSRMADESAADGSFSLAGLEDRGYAISVEANGFGRASVQDVEPGGEPLVIELSAAGSIRGRALTGDPPRPVEGFTVVATGKDLDELPRAMSMWGFGESRMAYHEPSGEFTIGDLAAGSYSVKVEASGFVPERVEKIEVGAGAASDLGDIHMGRGATIHGTVIEKGSGTPIGGAVVKTEEAGLFRLGAFRDIGTAALATGPDGRFSLSGLAPGRHTIRADHEQYSTQKLEVEIAAAVPPAEVSIELGSGGAIEGTFRDAGGNPVAGGMVIAMLGLSPDPNTMTSADPDGHFRIESLTPGTYRVMAIAQTPGAGGDQSDLMAGMQMQTVEVTDGETTLVNIPPEAGTIAVTGILRKGSDPVEARMFWTRLASDGASPQDFASATSGGDGAFQVRLSGPGKYQVGVQPTGEGQDFSTGFSLKVDIPDEPEVTRDLEIPDIVVAGIVIDADTGEPLSGVQVAALEPLEGRPFGESRLMASGRTEDDGRYRIEGMSDGTFHFSFSREGYGAETVGPMEIAEDSREEALNAALIPATEVTIRVSDPRGNPVQQAFVMALGYPAMVVAGTTGQTDMNGEVVLGGLTEGTHEIGVIAAGFAPGVARDVLVPAEDQLPVRIELPDASPLTIVVIDANEQPVSGASVRIREDGGSDLTPLLRIAAVFQGRGLMTGSDGTLRIPALASGRYEVEVIGQDVTAEEKVRVRSGEENRLQVDLR